MLLNYNYHDAVRPHVDIMSLGDWPINKSSLMFSNRFLEFSWLGLALVYFTICSYVTQTLNKLAIIFIMVILLRLYERVVWKSGLHRRG